MWIFLFGLSTFTIVELSFVQILIHWRNRFAGGWWLPLDKNNHLNWLQNFDTISRFSDVMLSTFNFRYGVILIWTPLFDVVLVVLFYRLLFCALKFAAKVSVELHEDGFALLGGRDLLLFCYVRDVFGGHGVFRILLIVDCHGPYDVIKRRMFVYSERFTEFYLVNKF